MNKNDSKKFFYEFRSLIYIKTLFPDLYYNPKKINKIDILDGENNTGIEVTICVNEGVRSEITDFKSNIPRTRKDKKRYRIKDAIVVNSNNMRFVWYYPDKKYFLECFKKKLKKLQERYSTIERLKFFDLYIIDIYEMGIDNNDIDVLLKKMFLEQKELPFKYRYVYIQSNLNIHIYDLMNQTYNIKTISLSLYHLAKQEAEVLTEAYIKELTKK